MASRKFWLDVDCGVDDAQGILLFAAEVRNHMMDNCEDHQRISIVAISCVSGNVLSSQVAVNVKKILSLSIPDHTEIPVYIGACKPLVEPLPEPSNYFGVDGLGDVDTDHLHLTVSPTEADNVDVPSLLVEAAKKFGESLTIVATGPLTNVAMACQLDAMFAPSVGHFFVMGGSIDETKDPEFNFQIDPDAAQICLQNFPMTSLITWECGLDHVLTWASFYRWHSQDSVIATFMRAACRNTATRQENEGYKGYVSCDSVAMAAALYPDTILESVLLNGTVIVGSDREDKGKLLIGLRMEPNLKVIKRLDKVRLFSALEGSMQ